VISKKWENLQKIQSEIAGGRDNRKKRNGWLRLPVLLTQDAYNEVMAFIFDPT
jgi:hypothetical protein